MTDSEKHWISRTVSQLTQFKSGSLWKIIVLNESLLLDHSQLIKEGLAIATHLRTNGLPPPHKLRHDRYGFVNGYRRCTLDGWYGEFVGRKEVKSTDRSAKATYTAFDHGHELHVLVDLKLNFTCCLNNDHGQSAHSPGIPVI